VSKIKLQKAAPPSCFVSPKMYSSASAQSSPTNHAQVITSSQTNHAQVSHHKLYYLLSPIYDRRKMQVIGLIILSLLFPEIIYKLACCTSNILAVMSPYLVNFAAFAVIISVIIIIIMFA